MPIVPKSLVHVIYRTRRFAEMLTWYATVFGARIQYQNPALAFLTFDDEHHRFAFADLGVIRPDEYDKDDRGMIGVDHVAWEYGSGTGNSTLSYLKDFPADEIKIDKSFITNLATNEHNKALVRSTIELTHELKMQVVAESIEDACCWKTSNGFLMSK